MCALQSARPQREYPCGQQHLYTIAETGWANFAQYLTRFETFNTHYSAAKGEAQLLAISDARDLPDEFSRTEVHKTLRVQLKKLSETCLITWSDMGAYIRDSFDPDEYDNKRLAAGYHYYRAAANEDWDSVKGLMHDGLVFLNANGAILAASGGMPPTFIATYTAAQDAFELKYQAFLQAEEQTKQLTDAKLLANNAVYKNLIIMFDDGKKIFRADAAIREQFTFDRIWALVDGHIPVSNSIPSTEIRIEAFIYDKYTNAPLSGVRLTIFNVPGGGMLTAISNAEGMLSMTISGFAPNQQVVLQGELVAEGYIPEMGDVETTAGSLYSIDAGLERVA